MSPTRAHAGTAETTDVRGRFDDESRSYTVVTTVARGRAHMTVLRREDVQSADASWNRRSYRMGATPILTIVPLIIRRLRGPAWPRHLGAFVRSPSSAPLVRDHEGRLQRRPQEPHQFARDRDHDRGARLIHHGEVQEASTQPLLSLIRNLNDAPRLPFASTCEGDAHARPVLVMPRRINQ